MKSKSGDLKVGVVFCMVILSACLVLAMSSANYSMNSVIVDSGGGNTNSTNYETDVIIETPTGTVSSENYTAEFGFFYGGVGGTADNVAPEVLNLSLLSIGVNNYTDENLNCSFVVNDDRSDELSATVRWYKNGELNLTSYYGSYSRGTLVSAILSSGNTTKHDNWSCSVQVVQNEYLKSDWGNSSNLTILNAPPTIVLTGPENNSATTDRSPEFNWTYNDLDDDVVTFEINITPYYGENPSILDERSDLGFGDNYYIPTYDLLALYDNGYHYRWKVRADDGEVTTNWTEQWRVNITAEIGILLLNDEIHFGSMEIGESNSTEDPSIEPFLVENNGTVVINVSLNASQLWKTRPENSSDYQFKVDENSLEAGSFDLFESIMNWFNVPLTGYVVGIGELNYTDVSDTAEVDINLTVPSGEDPGQKSSTIVFLAELAE